MAADVALGPQAANPCCAELKKRYLKLEEKRNALRQAVKLLESQANKLQDENITLRKACEEERGRADLAQAAKEKETEIKNILKKEIQDLKSEVASLQENGSLRNQERDRLLETRISQGEAEIKRLQELLRKEIERGDTVKKKVVEEKKKAAEAWKLVKIEKSKAEEEKRISDMERKKAEEMRHCLAKSKSEASEAIEKLTEERSKSEAANDRVELEMQKANRERKRADSDRARVEEQKKLVEMEKRKLMDEKNRADHLSQQLEEEKRKRNELQKQMEEIISTGQGMKTYLRKTKPISSGNEDTQSENMKLLKNKLKLLKDQVKHAKKVSKLEKVEKQLLLKQLYLLKQDHIQFSRRLEMLISCSSYGMEGTDGFAKVGGSLKQCAMEPERKFMCAEQDFNYLIGTGTKTNRTMGPIIPCSWCLPKKSEGRPTRTISGITSDLESPVGDSVREKSQNSAICSTAVTYSDTQLMGSQGRSAFAVAPSVNLAKDNFQGSPSLNGEETKFLHVAQQNNDGSVYHRNMEVPCVNSIVSTGPEVAQIDSDCNRGKRKPQLILDRECDCCLKVDNNNSVSEDINSKSFIPSFCRSDDIYSSYGGKNFVTELSDGSDTRKYKFCAEKKPSKRHKPSKQHKLSFRPSEQVDNHTEAYGCEADGHWEACFVDEAAFTYLDAMGHALACRNKASDIAVNDQAGVVCAESIIPEDFIKLLDLDDADEARYRAAKEMPMSPSLPELDSPSRRHTAKDYHNTAYGEFDGKQETKEERLVSVIGSNGLNYNLTSSSQEQLNYCLIPEEINQGDGGALVNQTSNSLRTHHTSASELLNVTEHGAEPCDQDSSEHIDFRDTFQKTVAMDEEVDLSLEGGSLQTAITWEDRSSMMVESAKQMSFSNATLNGPKGPEDQGLGGCCVVPSNTKDEQVISRVVVTTNAIMCDTSWDAETGFPVTMVLHALAVKLDLSAQEKACILFSLLLNKASAIIPVDCAIDMVGDLSLKSDLVTAEMARVTSSEETRSFFLARCHLDIFVNVIQDFLTARKVVICEETLHGPSDLCTSNSAHHLDSGNRTWSLRGAAINEVVAGSIILASIGTVYDRVDILWHTSFQLLRMCRGDSFWILTAVHVFACICGAKFFSPTNHNLIITALKPLVLLLERGQESGVETSDQDEDPRFPVCTECPFAEDEVCVDKVTSWLLAELRSCIGCTTRHPESEELVISSYNTLQACKHGGDGCDPHKGQFDGSKECNTFCHSHNFVRQLDQNSHTSFCHFIDIISLVELFGYYMGWEHLQSKIIQQLFTMLESCSSSAFSVSLLVLIGRLGRIGKEVGGCGERDAEGLLCRLSVFLDINGREKHCLPVQLAAVDALLNLQPLDLTEIVNGRHNLSLVTSQVVHVKHICRWFHQLSEEQKTLSLRLFQNSEVKRS